MIVLKKEIIIYILAITVGTVGWTFITSHGPLFGILSIGLIMVGITIHYAATNRCPKCKNIMSPNSAKRMGDKIIIKFVCGRCGQTKYVKKLYMENKLPVKMVAGRSTKRSRRPGL